MKLTFYYYHRWGSPNYTWTQTTMPDCECITTDVYRREFGGNFRNLPTFPSINYVIHSNRCYNHIERYMDNINFMIFHHSSRKIYHNIEMAISCPCHKLFSVDCSLTVFHTMYHHINEVCPKTIRNDLTFICE